MWCLKCLGEYHPRIMLDRRYDIQVFQNRKFAVCGRDELLQARSRHPKADTAHMIAALESNHYSFFIFCCEVVVIFVEVINSERKGRRMCQHLCYGSPR